MTFPRVTKEKTTASQYRCMVSVSFLPHNVYAMVARHMQWPCMCLSVCPCVYVSVTSRNFIKMPNVITDHANNAARHPRKSSFLTPQCNSNGVTPNGGAKYTRGGKICNFRQITR